VSIEEI